MYTDWEYLMAEYQNPPSEMTNYFSFIEVQENGEWKVIYSNSPINATITLKP